MKVVHIFRRYAALAVVVSCAVLVSSTNLAASQGSSGFLFGYWNGFKNAPEDTLAWESKIDPQTAHVQGLALVPLASAYAATVENAEKTPEVPTIAAIVREHQDDIPFATTSGAIEEDPKENGGVVLYTVQSGDTIGGIATAYDVSINTILWANEIENIDEISPGDQIFILPLSGLQHTVKSGDTIESIAKEYEAEKEQIISFNSLPANGALEDGQKIVIPGGQKETPVEEPALLERRDYAPGNGTIATKNTSNSEKKRVSGNNFPYGYCTYYVAQKRNVPWRGNAGAWLYNAKAMGYKTGKTPTKGAIVVTTDNAYYGHVAYVEKVGSGTITVSEMNYNGWGKVNMRVISTNSRSIRGYIY